MRTTLPEGTSWGCRGDDVLLAAIGQ